MRFRNEGNVDRMIRGAIGVLLVLSGAGLPSGLAVELLGVAVIVTAAVGWCPIYQVLHIRTNDVAIRH